MTNLPRRAAKPTTAATRATAAARSAAPAAPAPDRIVEAKLPSDHPLIDQLETLMHDLIVRYEQLKSLSTMHLDAIKAADARALAGCVRQENELLQQVAETERTRIRVVGQLADHLGAPSQHDTTMGFLASRVRGPRSGALSATADRLRTLMGEVAEINAIARAAAEQLARHMDGLLRELTRPMNHAQVYSAAGRVDPGATVTSSLDLRS